MEKLMEISHVGYSYHTMEGETPALININFTVHKGDFLSIVGPSGCGKSTLLSLLSGLIEPEHGSILLYGQKLFQKGSGTIGYMLQHDHLFEWRTIEKNVLLGLEIQNRLTPENKEKVMDMLERYGLYKFKDSRPSQLSGGMRQRAALIRTLALEPELLLLDEPFSALDYQTRLTVGDDIGSIIKKEQKTAILVTHDLSEAVSLGSQVLVLSKRPGTVKSMIPITFSDNLTPLERRNTPEFKDYFNIIWKELNSDD
ncbi:ABC transporter ATP-binding protein [Roseburia sp. 499]|uniref:ABC transporter ATP-binding protein n=1 Tax=Roseburia sp. 499 TaxID=1261634 RepID=UPI0009514F96|nr:ATP-binding cassette domain-containing protein [Roseburia sp. 499]WVK71554.1 ATP-binding cassette domain-containing protein [Roseburia sp. 499]